MGRTDQQCSICSAPDNVRLYVENQVAQRRKLRDLEKEVAFSRSVISNHMRKCVPKRTALDHREVKKLNMNNRRLVVEWPEIPGFARHMFTLSYEYDAHGHPIERHDQELIELSANEWRDSDVILQVEYQNKPFRNPPKEDSPKESIQDAPPSQ